LKHERKGVARLSYDFFTTDEVADILRVSRKAVTDMCRLGRIGATKVGERWLIPRESLDVYLNIRR